MPYTSGWKNADRMCPKCKKKTVVYRDWESSDGAHEDEEYKCTSCKYSWWIDGIDS